MPALAILVLVAYLLLLAFALAVWAALTLRQRDELGRSAEEAHATGIREPVLGQRDAATWNPRIAGPPPPNRGLTNDDVRGLRAAERRSDTAWLGPELDDRPRPRAGRRSDADPDADPSDGSSARAKASGGRAESRDRETVARRDDASGGSAGRTPEGRAGGDSSVDDDEARRRRGEDAFERFLRAESPKR